MRNKTQFQTEFSPSGKFIFIIGGLLFGGYIFFTITIFGLVFFAEYRLEFFTFWPWVLILFVSAVWLIFSLRISRGFWGILRKKPILIIDQKGIAVPLGKAGFFPWENIFSVLLVKGKTPRLIITLTNTTKANRDNFFKVRLLLVWKQKRAIQKALNHFAPENVPVKVKRS